MCAPTHCTHHTQNDSAELVEVEPSGLRFLDVFGAASVCIGWAGGTYEFFRWYLRIEDDWSVHTRAAGRGPMGCGPMG